MNALPSLRAFFLCTLVALPLLVRPVLPQNAPTSCQASPPQPSTSADGAIAAAARDAKGPKPHAKRVFTDEDMEVSTGPLPRLKMDGPENADEVVAAISAYKLKHTPAETERAVHIWYDRYDEMLAAAIQDNIDLRALREANSSNGYELCRESGDYQQCAARQMADQRGARNDQVQM